MKKQIKRVSSVTIKPKRRKKKEKKKERKQYR
jgi:hypothetical protein